MASQVDPSWASGAPDSSSSACLCPHFSLLCAGLKGIRVGAGSSILLAGSPPQVARPYPLFLRCESYGLEGCLYDRENLPCGV